MPSDELPGPTNILLSQDTDRKGSQLPPHKDKTRWERVEEEDSDLEFNNTKLNVATSEFIPVEDYVYPNSNFLHLGQSFKQFTDIKFPPDDTDLVAFNGGEKVARVINELYDSADDSETNGREGKGKIMHLSQAYLQHTPGWYRIVRKEKAPYMDKIRTPGKRTVIDKYRMPQIVFAEVIDTVTHYKATPVEWEMRLSGDEESNRGPGIFFSSSTGDPQESKISSMAFYRDRLFLSNEDTVIASRSGDWDNFFLADPDNITDLDPLDLMISSNNYTPVTHMVPFRDFLFVGTSGNTQYELTGSNNVVSPLSAEFAPTAFYPMMPDVPPIAMNNNLFFYSKSQLFIYFGQRDLATEQAFEVSKHVPTYLPDSLIDATSSSFGSMLFALEDASSDLVKPSTVYCYRNQVSGEKIVQNAFFDWTFSSPVLGDRVDKLQSWDKYLYVVMSNAWYGTGAASSAIQFPKLWVARIRLDNLDVNIPRLDNLRVVNSTTDLLQHLYVTESDISYDESTNKTTINFRHASSTESFGPPFWNYMITDEGEVIQLTRVITEGVTAGTYTAEGFLDPAIAIKIRWVGQNFTSSVTLSPIYLRDEANNIAPGTLNLRTGLIQTYNSKMFDVNVDVNNRAKKKHTFIHDTSDDRWDDDWIGAPTITGEIAERQERFPILGFTEDVKITISSDNPHPLNIASLQFSGKFKPITRYHNS